MTAERLEELARRCDEAIADTSNGFGAYFDAQDIADLARCARAWAKVERIRGGTLYINRKTATYFNNVNDFTNADTAIEAVEAAEATDANKG